MENNIEPLKIIYFKQDFGTSPTKAHHADAGWDLYTNEDVTIRARSSAIIDTGTRVIIPEEYVGFLKSKSGLNVKHNIVSEGVIDSGYTGTIVVKLYNHGDEDYTFKAGDKITQLVIIPCLLNSVNVDEHAWKYLTSRSERKENGFGSSGR